MHVLLDYEFWRPIFDPFLLVIVLDISVQKAKMFWILLGQFLQVLRLLRSQCSRKVVITRLVDSALVYLAFLAASRFFQSLPFCSKIIHM